MKKPFALTLPTILIALSSVCFLSSCCPVYFNQTALSETTDIKKATLELVGNAVNPYADYESKGMELKSRMENRLKSVEMDKCDKSVAKMWRLMLDENKNLYGGFLKLWKEQNTLGKTFIQEYKKELGNNFDKITALENEKKKQ